MRPDSQGPLALPDTAQISQQVFEVSYWIKTLGRAKDWGTAAVSHRTHIREVRGRRLPGSWERFRVKLLKSKMRGVGALGTVFWEGHHKGGVL